MDAVPREQLFARRVFREYYERHPPGPIRSLEKREFGFLFFDRTYMERHRGFGSEGELSRFLVSHVPAHVYHSAAIYARPDAPRMEEKGWEGAELIFDLDADHVRGAEKLDYVSMLRRVKDGVARLFDDFICSDLGFTEEEVEIYFSGGRGYHIHVTSDSVMRLGSHERREIADYITGNGLSIQVLSSAFGEEMRIPRNGGGWAERIRKASDLLMERIEAMEQKEAVAMLSGMGVREAEAKRIYNALKAGSPGRRFLEEGNLGGIAQGGKSVNSITQILENIASEEYGGEMDQPVTSDIHRLIRAPWSLHGKTGFRVVGLKRSELDSFDPLLHAVLDKREETEVYSKTSFTPPPVCGWTGELREGRNVLPLPLALFLMLRRQVTLPGSNGSDIQQQSYLKKETS